MIRHKFDFNPKGGLLWALAIAATVLLLFTLSYTVVPSPFQPHWYVYPLVFLISLIVSWSVMRLLYDRKMTVMIMKNKIFSLVLIILLIGTYIDTYIKKFAFLKPRIYVLTASLAIILCIVDIAVLLYRIDHAPRGGGRQDDEDSEDDTVQ